MEEILECIAETLSVAAYVKEKEALMVYDGPESDIRQQTVPIDLQPLIDRHLLLVATIDSEREEEAFVTLASKMDDGEAMTAAIAIERDWGVATDDKRAIAIISQAATHVEIISTPALIKHWFDYAQPSAEILRVVLRNIRARALYEPARNHPLRDWWEKNSG
jgi:predicted nucleic acid-binding protein